MTDDELAHWRDRALAAERWRDEVWEPLQQRLAQAQRAEDLAERVSQMESSLSWRMTAPLRAAAELRRKLRAR